MTAKTIEGKINQTWKSICNESNIAASIHRSYVSCNTDLPRFYHLIKTHKNTPTMKVRPIVSNKGGPSYKISWLLSRLLKPLLNLLPTHLQSSLQLMETITAIPRNVASNFSYPFSLDVISLYTSIPPEEAIQALAEHLETSTEVRLPLSVNQISALLTTILKNTYFQYNGKIFQQISGLPMGNSVSGLLAMIYMARIENQAINNLNIGLHKRYVDDIIILTKDRQEAENIFQIMNSLNEHVKFEVEHPNSSNSICLLDFCLTIDNDGNPHFCFYRKAAKRNMFPHYSSAIPLQVKKAAIHNELERISQRCSSVADQHHEKAHFLTELKSRGYRKIYEKRKRRRKEQKCEVENVCFFEFPFINDRTHQAIKNAFKAANLPVRVYSKNQTLRSLLTRRKSMESCNIRNCSINNAKLCNTKMCVYEIRWLKPQHIHREHRSSTPHKNKRTLPKTVVKRFPTQKPM